MNPLRAIILEDDISWQQILNEILTDAGLDVDVVSQLHDGLKVLSQQSHRLAVVDLSLDEKDPHNQEGLEFIAGLKKRDPDCVVILLTGYATVEIAVTALTDLGVYTCLKKENFHRENFKSLIDQVLSLPVNRIRYRLKKDPILTDTDPLQSERQPVEFLHALIVEDDAGWREILQEIIAESGYVTHICTSYGEALGRIRRESYHLLVVDLSLDGAYSILSPDRVTNEQDFAGFRLLDSMYTMKMPVIVVSGAATMDDVERAYQEYNIFAFVEKQTFDRHAFSQILNDIEGKHSDLVLLNSLTQREKNVLELLAQGLTNKEIAKTLVITPNTVKRHLKAIFEKLDIHTRSAAASMAANWFRTFRYEDQHDVLDD
jgi:two-component system, response regulator PdtaR